MSKFSDTHLAQLISEIPQTAFASSSKLAVDKRKENNGSCKASCDIRERNKGLYNISQNIIVNGKNVDTNKKGKNKFYC